MLLDIVSKTDTITKRLSCISFIIRYSILDIIFTSFGTRRMMYNCANITVKYKKITLVTFSMAVILQKSLPQLNHQRANSTIMHACLSHRKHWSLTQRLPYYPSQRFLMIQDNVQLKALLEPAISVEFYCAFCRLLFQLVSQ